MRIVHSLFRNKQGVSEIIASLILILIVSAGGVLVYSIGLETFSSSTSHFQLQMDQREEEARERLAILAVWRDTSNQLNLTVLNYGKTDLTVDAVYVNGTVVSTYLSERGVNVATCNITYVKFDSPVPLVSGEVYEIIVVSERGSKNEISWRA